MTTKSQDYYEKKKIPALKPLKPTQTIGDTIKFHLKKFELVDISILVSIRKLNIQIQKLPPYVQLQVIYRRDDIDQPLLRHYFLYLICDLPTAANVVDGCHTTSIYIYMS